MTKVLVVDDDPQILRLFTFTFKNTDFKAITATHGTSGLELYDAERPDIIICDILMPDMDGFEFCMRIREGNINPMVPFIFMTTADSEGMEVKGYRAGADDFMAKPIEREELINRMERLLERRRRLNNFSAVGAADDAVLQGDLTEIGLTEIIQMLALNNRSGILLIRAEDKSTARLYFDTGKLLHSDGDFGEGLTSLTRLVGLQNGTFSFDARADKMSIERSIDAPTMSVIMEACRLHDEMNN
jgi:DNA-binding response OmpR family regulator